MEYGRMVTEAQARASLKFQRKTYDNVVIKIRKDTGDKQKIQDYADSLNLPLAVFIKKSIQYVMDNQIKLK